RPMSRFLLWTLRVALGVVMFCASVGPKQAGSNVSAWLALVGIQPPTALTLPSIDRPIALTALIVFVLTFLVPRADQWRKAKPLPISAGGLLGRRRSVWDGPVPAEGAFLRQMIAA